MAKERSFTFDYSGNELREEPHQSYSILRSKFDRWLAERVEEKGIMLLAKTRVDKVIRNNAQIAGVVAGGDELRADVVIACDGALSLISEKAGLRASGSACDFAIGVKEMISIDSVMIDDRFNLEGKEGAARLFAGEVTRGRFGGGFLYTNRESLSLGLVIGIEDAAENREPIEVPLLIEEFKERP